MKVYVIGGTAKSGKTTLANYLKENLTSLGYKPCIIKLTDPLYRYAEKYFNKKIDEENKPREFLQQIGIEIIKNKLHKDKFLLERTEEDIEILKNFFDVFIITDIRLKMEYEEFKNKYSDITTINIKRPNFDNNLTKKEKNHITEKDLEDYNDYDYTIINDKNDDLYIKAKKIIKETIKEKEYE